MPGITNLTNLPPDPEIVFRAWMLSKTSITDQVSTRIATRLPAEATLPFVVIRAEGNALLDEQSQSAIGLSSMRILVYAGRWGNDGTKPEPDFGTASDIAQIIYKECYTESNVQVTTSGGTKAHIYTLNIESAPIRSESRELQVAVFDMSISMTYRYSE